MTLRTSIAGQIATFGATAALNWPTYQAMPERVPMHWNMQGEVDRYGSKSELLAMFWVFFGMCMLFSLIIPAAMTKEQRQADKGGKMAMFLLGQAVFMCILATVILRISAGVMQLQAISLLIWVALIAVGWLCTVLPPQFINMPGLNNEQKMVSAKRMAKVYTWGSLIGIWLTLGGAPEPYQFGWMMIVALYPVVELFLPKAQPEA